MRSSKICAIAALCVMVVALGAVVPIELGVDFTVTSAALPPPPHVCVRKCVLDCAICVARLVGGSVTEDCATTSALTMRTIWTVVSEESRIDLASTAATFPPPLKRNWTSIIV
jgi:hypothetical protein